MKKLFLIAVMLFSAFFSHAQEAEEEVDNRPVRNPFISSHLIDQQTHVTPGAKGWEFLIHHRFGQINDIKDLYGIYGPSNIRMGVDYGITDDIMVGFGTEKNNMLQELHWKYAILKQTRSDKMPVSLSYYGAVNIDGRDKVVYGENYKFSNRLSYYHQLIMGRMFNKKLSIQGTASYAHFNAVDSIWHNDRFGVSLGGKYTVWNKMSVIAEYDFPMAGKTVRYYQARVKPNVALGIELGTSTHAFQIFVANYQHIMAAKNLAFNTNDFQEGEFLFGFNITVRL